MQINDRLQYNPVKMYLTSIVIDALPQMGMGGHEGHIQVLFSFLKNNLVTSRLDPNTKEYLLEKKSAVYKKVYTVHSGLGFLCKLL